VSGIDLVDATHAKVTFSANGNQPITSKTWAIVRYANLIGDRYLELAQFGSAAATVLPFGGTIPEQHARPALSLTALFNGFRPLFSALTPQQVNQLSEDLVGILQGQTSTIDDLVARTADLTSNLAGRDQTFDQVIDSLSTLLNTVSDHDAQLAGVVTTLHALTVQLHTDGPAITNSLGSVDQLIGSVGSLLGQVEDHNLPGDLSDAASITGVLAKNTKVLAPLTTGFARAFGDFARITQNGSFVNAYICRAGLVVDGTPSFTGADAVTALDQLLSAGLPASVTKLLTGLPLSNLNVNVPLKLPQGAIGNPARHSQVCP
jgi:phospholipid/cholesterol/gamma-HCH transport system substrate-binding protein